MNETDLLRIVMDFNDRNEPIWFTRLVKIAKETPSMVLHWLNTLTDWGLIESYTGETEKGRAGFLYRVTEFAIMAFAQHAKRKEAEK